MRIYGGLEPYIRLQEMGIIERAVFTVWLLGMDRPPGEEDAAWLEDYLRFIKERREQRKKARFG